MPDMQTLAGQSVQAMREQLKMVPVDVITYGVVFHPHLSTSGCRMPTAVQRSMRGKSFFSSFFLSLFFFFF